MSKNLSFENPLSIHKGEKEKSPDYYYKIFQEISGANPEIILESKKFFKSLPKLPKNSFKAAYIIRQYLIKKGFEYDDKTFCLQDIMKSKKGNCLGLSLLIGAVLYEKEYQPKFRIVSHPEDIISKKEIKFFEELNSGDYFNYDNPTLPSEQAEHPLYRFAPLEHPQLILEGRPFEATDLEENKNKSWTVNAEMSKEVNYEQMTSYVYLDRARNLIDIENYNNKIKEVKELCNKSLSMWNENREAYCLLYSVGREESNKDLMSNSLEKYMQIGGNDSQFLYNAYLMTGDESYLDKSLDKFPAFILAFTTKKVYHEKDLKEAKFNLAVASWCIANSAPVKLKDFYLTHEKKIIDLYGEEKYRELILKLGK